MYTLTREIVFKTAADGIKGRPIAEALCKYFKDAHKLEMKLMRPVFGSPNRMRFVAQFESLDTFEALSAKAMKDPAYHKLLAEIAPTVDGSKTFDDMWE